MKIEVILTDGDGEVRKRTLFQSTNTRRLVKDLYKMEGINVYQELYNSMKCELKQFLRYKMELDLVKILGKDYNMLAVPKLNKAFDWNAVKD